MTARPGLRPLLLAAVATLLLAPAALDAQTRWVRPGDPGCVLCHGELELLRQHTATLEEAEALLVPPGMTAASAHDTLSCGGCHTGFEDFPHREIGPATEGCVSCHEEQHDLWEESIHATADETAECADCHGVHDVLWVEEIVEEGPGMRAVNARCVSCHETSPLPVSDPHRDSIPCASCHSAHQTLPVQDVGAWVAPLAQQETCGACHEEVADSAARDAHGLALAEADIVSLAELDHLGPEAPATCTSCHGSHGMLAPSHEHFDQDMVDECAVCHQDYADTYFGTYHGKATAVGSEVVATCDHCHGAHRIFGEDEPASMVAEANLVETCATCHENARPAFVEYESHPEPMNREKNPPLFYSFVFMNTLLFGVLGVFALHTALWWVRLMLDKRKGIQHGPGANHHG